MKRKKIVNVSIETTNACNLFCSACKTPHGHAFMSPPTFTKLAKRLEGHASTIGLHWRGEPCLHPQLPKLAEIAKGLGFKPWASTNTAVPNLSNPDYVKKLLDNLDWIEFCVDGYDENTASKYRRGANWEQIKRNLLTLSKIKTKCPKKLRVLIFKYNDDKEDIYREMAKTYGMDEVVFAAPLIGLASTIDMKTAEKWLSENRKYQRYRKRGGAWHRITGKCKPGPIVAVTGFVYPCCLDWELEYPLGNLKNEGWGPIVNRYHKMKPQLGKQEMCNLCCIPHQQVNFGEKII